MQKLRNPRTTSATSWGRKRCLAKMSAAKMTVFLLHCVGRINLMRSRSVEVRACASGVTVAAARFMFVVAFSFRPRAAPAHPGGARFLLRGPYDRRSHVLFPHPGWPQHHGDASPCFFSMCKAANQVKIG